RVELKQPPAAQRRRRRGGGEVRAGKGGERQRERGVTAPRVAVDLRAQARDARVELDARAQQHELPLEDRELEGASQKIERGGLGRLAFTRRRHGEPPLALDVPLERTPDLLERG